MAEIPEKKKQLWLDGYEHAYGKTVRLPDKPIKGTRAADAPNAAELLARVIDADCRAYHPDLGYHYDSRCLDHLTDAIEYLAQSGAFDVLDDGEEASGRRIRTGVVQGENLMADRPMFDPAWQRAMEENAALRQEVDTLRAENAARAEEMARAAAAEAQQKDVPTNSEE
jgi:hypothetical protein